MSRERPRVPRTLVALSAIWDDYPPTIKNALAIRNAALVEGRCPDCGAAPTVVGEIDPGRSRTSYSSTSTTAMRSRTSRQDNCDRQPVPVRRGRSVSGFDLRIPDDFIDLVVARVVERLDVQERRQYLDSGEGCRAFAHVEDQVGQAVLRGDPDCRPDPGSP